MTKAAGAVLTDIYDAWRAQDLDWLASYLPDEFAHMMHVPAEFHPLAGLRGSKKTALERWRALIPNFEVLSFDTSKLIIVKDRAAVEIPLRYRHKATGKELVTTKANFWMLEDGWPVRLTEYFDIASIAAFNGSIRRGHGVA